MRNETERTVQQLYRTDAIFKAVCDQMGAHNAREAWEMLYTPDGISKMSPDSADVHFNGPTKAQKRPMRYGVLRPTGKRKVQKNMFTSAARNIKANGLPSPLRFIKKKKEPKPGRTGSMIAAGVGGAGTAILAARQQNDPNSKFHTKVGAFYNNLMHPKPTTMPETPEYEYGKSTEWEATISKTDDEKRLVFGWASIISKNGKPVIDRQGDIIDEDEMEKSAYEYVIKSRTGGRQHRRDIDGSAFKASDMVESMVLTEEKKQHLGLPPETPTGWWVGFKVHDDDTWNAVKRGEVTGFSIHGKGKRVPVEGLLHPQSTEGA